MQALARYQNGNCDVVLLKDGTKFIKYDEPAKPDFPMSIDLKITDKCYGDCAWCHENSNEIGAHADPQFIYDLVRGLPKGTELAIGGGDPFEHPKLTDLLFALKQQGFIVNMTVNAKHLTRHLHAIQCYRKYECIHGLGVSWNWAYPNEIAQVMNDNTVLHFIAGLHNVPDVINNLTHNRKCLILGYKNYGRGTTDWPFIQTQLSDWKTHALELIKAGHVAFDTLALTQLNIKSIVAPEIWEHHYMGDDGHFTMYIDAVKMQYATSSTAERFDLTSYTAQQAFQKLRTSL